MASVEHGRADLGPWAGDDLRRTARTTSAVGVDSDLPDEVRFTAGVAKLIQRRIAEVAAETDSKRPAIFLLMPSIRSRDLDTSPERVPMLNNGLTAIAGRLWFVSPVAVTGYFIDLEDCDDDALFLLITDDLQLGDVPAVIFDPRTGIPEFRFYRNGLSNPEYCEVSRIDSADVSLAHVFHVIDRIHETSFVTPGAQEPAGRLWEDGLRYWPKKDAELKVQLYLRAGLQGAFLTCEVRSEKPLVSGRFDIAIVESDPLDRSRVTWHTVLELKVLRSYGSTGKPKSEKDMLDWIESGVRQAAAYRNERGALAAALCCFDMRCKNAGEQCFGHVIKLAAEHKIVLKSWFIYATSKLYREAMIASPKS